MNITIDNWDRERRHSDFWDWKDWNKEWTCIYLDLYFTHGGLRQMLIFHLCLCAFVFVLNRLKL